MFIESNEQKTSNVKMPSIDLGARKHGSSVFSLSGYVYNGSNSKTTCCENWLDLPFHWCEKDEDDDGNYDNNNDDDDGDETDFMCKLRLIINDIMIPVLFLTFEFTAR